MARDEKFIKLALNIANLSQHPKFRLGAVIVKGSNVLSVGVNKLKTHPLQNNPHTNNKSLSIHAELCAILKLSGEQLKNSTIYVARILANGISGIAKPCDVCETLLIEAGIKRFVWTIQENNFESKRI